MLNVERLKQLVQDMREAVAEDDGDILDTKLDEIEKLLKDVGEQQQQPMQSERGKVEIERNKQRGEEQNTATTPPGGSTPERDISDENK